MNPCHIVAELSTVHLGQIDRAKNLIKLAHECGADYAKFQKRNPEESTPKEMWDKPHPNQKFAYGETYLAHRKALEFTIEQHAELKKYCEEIGIGYSCSVWDLTSAKEIIDLKPDYIKIGSPSNQNFEMISYIAKHFDRGLHISLGMVSITERDEILQFIIKNVVDLARVVVYHCTSEYPCPFERLYLKEIETLKSITVGMEIGFSNHGYGIAIDPVAYYMGATWIERHFVDDRTLNHSDSAAALEPTGFKLLCRNIRAVKESLKYRPVGISKEENAQRLKLKGTKL
jgi:sialic acid synthase